MPDPDFEIRGKRSSRQFALKMRRGGSGPPAPLSWIRHRLYLTQFSDHSSRKKVNPVAVPDLQIRGGGGGGYPDPEIRWGGAVSKTFFSALRVSVWSKNKGGRPDPPYPSPGSATETDVTNRC